MVRFFAYLTATFFYSGRARFAPGTAGSAASLIPLILAAHLLSPTVYAAVVPIGILLFLAAGIPAASYVEKHEGKEDPGLVVIDEAAGQWMTLLFIPGSLLAAHPWIFGAGFLLFRFFDIWKPFPARLAESLPRGYGIMADDVVAGLYACLVLNGIVKWVLL